MSRIRKITILGISLILFLSVIVFILNIEVTIQQGINYRVNILKMPLYLKILDFYDRHYNYKWLVHKIVQGKNSEENKVIAIFKWTIENILEQPKELPVFDDHVWHIIVRSYGVGEQFSDVFTTLCNYADFDAFFYRLPNKDNTSKIALSFVKVADRWCVFDPCAGVYFVTRGNNFASVEDLSRGNYLEINIKNLNRSRVDYKGYFENILSIDFERAHQFSRANIQSPINRFIYGVKKKCGF